MKNTLSKSAQKKIDQFLNLKIGDKKIQCPYFNNRRAKTRAGLKAKIGKGAPEKIRQEAKIELKKEGVDIENLTSEQLKEFLVDNNLGVDCSAFAYYVLEAELEARKNKSLQKKLDFSDKSLARRIISWWRTIENIDVKLLASEKNSNNINLKQVKPADLIIMENFGNKQDRDHILVINQVKYKTKKPQKIEYVHSLSWNKDGQYDHGVRKGEIKIKDLSKTIEKQTWLEKDEKKEYNETLQKAKQGNTKIKRLKVFA